MTAMVAARPRRDAWIGVPPPDADGKDDDSKQEIRAFLTAGPAFFPDQACHGHIHDLIVRSGKNISLTVYGSDSPMGPYDEHHVTQLPTVIFFRGGAEVARLERPRNNATIKTVSLLIDECFF